MVANVRFKKPCSLRGRKTPGGFTLVELLVVVVIIVILAGLLVPTVYRAIVKAQETAIAVEVAELKAAIEAYKNKFGDYPPDGTDAAAITNHLNKFYPRHRQTTAEITTFATALKPDEALVFWLSGVKNNPEFPLTGPGQPHNFFSFDEGRFNTPDADGDAYQSYYPQYGLQKPYLYFKPANPSTAVTFNYGTGTFTTYSGVREKFQIISAGLDGEYGVGGVSYPNGPYSKPDSDNITNFSEGKPLRDNK